jgi:hypothetical protein
MDNTAIAEPYHLHRLRAPETSTAAPLTTTIATTEKPIGDKEARLSSTGIHRYA